MRRRGSWWWGLAPVLLWAVLDWPGAVAGVALALWHLLAPPPPRALVAAAAALLGLVPVAWLAAGIPAGVDLNPALVGRRPAAAWLAAAAAVLLVVGVVRDVAGGSAAEAGDDAVEEGRGVGGGQVAGAHRQGAGAAGNARRADRHR